MQSDKKYTIWWDEKEKIARARAYGVLDEEAGLGILFETKKIAGAQGGKIDWLIDLSQMTKATSKARKLLAESSAHPSIRKYALCGASTYLRTVANFIAAAAGQKNARHFANEEEAFLWIREGE